MDEYMPLRLVPNPFTTAMMANAMPAAIRPYSIAVAPVVSDRKSRKCRFKAASCVGFRPVRPNGRTSTGDNLKFHKRNSCKL